ncbi:MAG: hypothetical protein Q7R52_01190 [archaeon]|nr:hypothetical protein [archaeon]
MKILFVCKHNRFRSKVAETIFNSLTKSKNLKSESAGLIMDDAHPYIEPIVLKLVNEKGYEMKNRLPRQLDRRLLGKFDLLIITANDVNPTFFHDVQNINFGSPKNPKNKIKNKTPGFFGFKKKIFHWKILDCDCSDSRCIKKSIDEIEVHIKELIKDLN